MVMNQEERNKWNEEALKNLKKREDIVPRIDEIIGFFAGLKKRLEDCDINEIPEEIVISANNALEYFGEELFWNTPECIEELLAYLYPRGVE